MAFPDNASAQALFGAHNGNLKLLGDTLGVSIQSFGNGVRLEGPSQDVAIASSVLDDLYRLIEDGHVIGEQDILGATGHYLGDGQGRIEDRFRKTASLHIGAKKVVPKTAAQLRYIEAIRSSDITFGVGPAGTGKTYLAVAMGLEMLSRKEVRRIIVSRPVVEAGEKLGFLPGDVMQKIDPYLRPIYDAIADLLDAERMRNLMGKGVIEVAPLAYMRGRTLNHTFILLDEAQNATRGQMKMFLTRLGENSRMVVNGDATQIDLPNKNQSGLAQAARILEGVPRLSVARFGPQDVIRHPIVTAILNAYEADEAAEAAATLPLPFAAPVSSPGTASAPMEG